MLESGIVGRALPRKKRTKEDGIGGFNSRAKMGSWFIPWPSLGVPNSSLTVMSDQL